jgi:large subunit ribosomal protein L23
MPAHVDSSYILKRPLLSEKSTYALNEQNRYAFVVDARATKTEIKAAVEKAYKVRVEGVNTITTKQKARRTKIGVQGIPAIKKAVIKIHKDDKIELM